MSTSKKMQDGITNGARSAGRSAPQSVGRIFAILDFLAETESGATLSELAVKANAPKTSLVGLLSGLTEEACLIRDEDGRYFLGPRLISLAMRATPDKELIATVHPVLEDLVGQTGETGVLGILAPEDDIASYIDKVESENPIRYAVSVGKRQQLYCSSIGKILMAHMAPQRLENYLENYPREKITRNTLTEVAELRKEIEKVHALGMAATVEEGAYGASGFGAPIFGRNGRVCAAIAIAGPAERLKKNNMANIRLVREAAERCTALIGGIIAGR
ncbi:MAG: IclR family transcriptional regulator [Alphaproteobacteria bacterium]|nr:MAG: IclR family transcriptional regulator [Alphaproteobacteria bacterium]